MACVVTYCNRCNHAMINVKLRQCEKCGSYNVEWDEDENWKDDSTSYEEEVDEEEEWDEIWE